MNCITPLVISVACCSEQIILKAGLQPLTQYYWVLKQQRNNYIYQKQVMTNETGDLIINVSDLPNGLIHQYAGLFELKIKEGGNYLNTVNMYLNDEERQSVFLKCVFVEDPVELNYTISTETIINNPNNA